VKMRGNQLLALDDPSSVWVVASGLVGVFGVAYRDGAPSGTRRYFFECKPGQAVFGLPAPAQGEECRVVVVAIEDTTLEKVDAGVLPHGPELAARWVDQWRRSLPAADLPEIESSPTPATLDSFHRSVIESVQGIDDRERRRESDRASEQERLSKLATREAVASLTSVLRPAGHSALQGSDLFVATAAVGRALGIRMRSPAGWEEASARADPVEMICRASHVRYRKVQLSGSWWSRDGGPILAFLREGRKPVALLQPRPGRYELFDPGTRTSTPVDEATAATIDSEAHVLYRPLPEGAAGGIELIRFALHGRSRELWTILATATAATLLGMFAPQAMALLVDHAIPDANVALLLQIGLGLLAAAGGAAVFRLAQGVALMRLETAADSVTQSAVWDHLLNLQLSFFRRFSTGDLQSRVTAISQIRSYLSGTTLRTLFSSVVLLLNLALLLYYSATLALIAVAVAVVSVAVTVASGAMILNCSRQILELQGRFFGLIVQLVNGVAKLRVAAAEERAFARWARDYSKLLRLELRRRTIQDNVQVVNIAVSAASAIVLYAAASSLIRADGISTGVFLAFHVAYGTFIGAIVGLSNTVTDVLAIAILRERARPILEAAPEVDEAKSDPGELAGKIELDHVVFRYDPEGPIVLDDVSVRIEAGQFVAIIGPSGSGKSTVLRLLLGLETPGSGSVFFDGQELSGLDVYAVRRQLGVVLQGGRINAGSLFDNIASGTRISLNDAWEAARSVGFAEEIEAMPMGMHTVISEGGTNLSGGQRQRLLLARALVHDPRILLLDEATSALDNQTQAIVSESLERLNVTRVVIAHRLSTIRKADRIYVVEAGRVAQNGSFDELAAEDGLFARLMARQMA